MEFEKLQDIIADVLNVSKDDIHPETTFVDDLGADSLRKSSILRLTMMRPRKLGRYRMLLIR
jgi:acyl carrier protein